MPQKAKAKPQTRPAPKPGPEPTTIAGLSVADFESAMQAEKLAFALLATMPANARRGSAASTAAA